MQSVDLDPSKFNVPMLMEVLKELGFRDVRHPPRGVIWDGGSYNMETGVMTVRAEEWGGMIKQAYSRKVVITQAKRFGWSVKTQADGKLLVQKAKF